MLTSRRFTPTTAALWAAGSLAAVTMLATTQAAATVLATSAPAAAQDGGVDCDGIAPVIDGETHCIPYARGPVTDGAPLEFAAPAGTGSTTCIRSQGVPGGSPPGELDRHGPREIPCTWTGVSGPGSDGTPRGFYTQTWDCYVELRLELAPASTMVGYHANGGPDGVVYRASCFPPPSTAGGTVTEADDPRGLAHWHTGPHGAEQDPDGAIWGGTGQLVVLPDHPPPAEPEPSLVDLWVEAVNQLTMRGPAVTTAPPTDTGGLVRLPTWLWTDNTTQTWPDQLHADAAATGVRVDAYAEPSHMHWDMGDDQPPVRCDGPGAAWQTDSDLHHPPPDACRHTYQSASRTQPDGVFHILAMTTWRVWWDINGDYDDELQIDVGTTATYQVNELQVLTR